MSEESTALCEVTVNIVGVGNTLMGDDGVGPVAVERLAARPLPDGVRLHDAGLAVSDVLSALDPAVPLLVIDAVRTGAQPGDVHRIRLADSLFEAGAPAAPISLHEISVVPALRIEALTGRAFTDVTVFGVEPGRVAWGEGLSQPVAAAVDRLIESVLEHVGAMRTCTPANEGRS